MPIEPLPSAAAIGPGSRASIVSQDRTSFGDAGGARLFFNGMCLMGIDAVVLNLPDRPANETTFGRPSGGERGDGALPQIRKVSLVELGTHVKTTFVPKPITTGEHSVISALLRHMPEDGLCGIVPRMAVMHGAYVRSSDVWGSAIRCLGRAQCGDR